MSDQQLLPAKPLSPFEEKITDDTPYRRFGFILIAVVFFGFGTWAALAPISSAALAPGTVNVESKRQAVQHLEGGIVKRIEVRDGDQVEKGQVLIVLDDTQARAQLEVVQSRYYLALAREARLIAQRDQRDHVEYPETLKQLAATDHRAREAMEVQDQIFEVRRSAYENELALYAQQAEQLESQLKGLEAQQRATRRLVASFSRESRDLKKLAAKGYAQKRKVREVQRMVSENRGKLGDLVAQIAATRSKIVESKLKALQLQREMQREIAAELDEVRGQLFELVEQRQALQDTLARTVIRAPQDGKVLGLSVHTVGAVIAKGQKLMEIVPDNERLVIEARVSPVDIDRVAVGQEADIRFSAFNTRDTPKIKGRLITLSADAIRDEKDPSQPPYYQAIIEIPPEGLAELEQKHLKLIPGMPAEAFIKTGERTFFQYLFNPLEAIVARSFIED